MAAEVKSISKFNADEKMATKKWSNLKSRYKSWHQKFEGVNSSGT